MSFSQPSPPPDLHWLVPGDLGGLLGVGGRRHVLLDAHPGEHRARRLRPERLAVRLLLLGGGRG